MRDGIAHIWWNGGYDYVSSGPVCTHINMDIHKYKYIYIDIYT